MHFHVLTLFPDLIDCAVDYGVVGRARERGVLAIQRTDIRDFATDRHRNVDDRPYGGGPGMVMLPEVADRAVAAARSTVPSGAPVVHLSPQGERLDHRVVTELAAGPGLILLCGRYEGIDERAVDHHVDREISLGDYVLSGGELAALVVIDTVARQIPAVLGEPASAEEDSFVGDLLDCPHYTRPRTFEGREVPPILLSGDHAAIEHWRLQQALGRTWLRRPDLLERRGLTPQERALLKAFCTERGEGEPDLAGIPERTEV